MCMSVAEMGIRGPSWSRSDWIVASAEVLGDDGTEEEGGADESFRAGEDDCKILLRGIECRSTRHGALNENIVIRI